MAAGAMSRFTVLGAGGFIGRALVGHLRAAGHEVLAVDRAGLAGFLEGRFPAGHVIDCIGLTGDFRSRPLETAEAHVGVVARVLGRDGMASLLLLSSTRVYARAECTREDAELPVAPMVGGDLYNVTKLAGEALCLSDPRPAVRVARLSNVYGPGMDGACFLGQVLAEGRASGTVTLRQGLLSTKDYVAVADVVALLTEIALGGRERVYNVASGANTTHDAIASVLARGVGWRIMATEGAATVRFPRIDITRIKTEFRMPRRGVLEDLPALAAVQRQEVAC
jgi:nucleoside-diphosphate-sugar epimerase